MSQLDNHQVCAAPEDAQATIDALETRLAALESKFSGSNGAVGD